jgi:hypothetical protein
VLATVLKTPDEEVDDYLRALAEMAEASDGLTDPTQTVGDYVALARQADHRAVEVRVDGGRLPQGTQSATVTAHRESEIR